MRRKGIIVLNNIYYKIGNKYILKNINTTIKSGDLLIASGSNGSGKSTLIKISSKIFYPSKGTVYNDFENISYIDNSSNPILDTSKTVLDNLLYLKKAFAVVDVNILKLVKIFEIENKLKTEIDHLSTGQRQKINIIFSILLKKNI